MEIRKASQEDYTTIFEIANVTWDNAYKSILSEAQLEYMMDMMYSPSAFTEQLNIKGHHFLMASIDGKDLGFASYELNYRYGVTKLHKLYVLPQTQGTGMGHALITAVENAAKANGNETVTLNVNRFNKAIHFYEKNGYANTGAVDVNIGNGYLMEDYVMEKSLSF
ncbi:acetyltransferase [Flavobacterium akiainvivens]|uniref:Acetyltransferase n=1 Tax=Flavobacterium akiainvivens TaxID=1202724 RepID=A0A0M9VHA5_9FLAO|nr:GNAT family N-acetyltransferase [Flavobacterium akiainvivens]KOS05360.1 acetyltransferase [Flavobacterium akiainvivens]SFQ73987.1 L-amino acid N-acyltransferase YncA [Flavobacterium akiainvivens]